ncbi:hypothetical protein HGB07_03510 [Candidatus Roizmanbacteria bacterium]|nr:hypothetical protein [Candidatus Roizmanbacteria bacterium]
MNYELINTNNEYRSFLSDEIDGWQNDGYLYAITGCFGSHHHNHKKLWDSKVKDITHHLNNFQRTITGSRYWKKALHKQVKAIIFPESASKLHYHGVILIPNFVYKDANNALSFELKELKVIDVFYKTHKKDFKNSCYIKRVECLKGWINYSTKNFDNPLNEFDMSDFLILP